MNSKKEFKVNPEYIVRTVANEYLLVSTGASADNKLMMLNETGYFVWKNLQEYTSLDVLISRAKNEFSGTDEIIAQQIGEFVQSLVEMGILKEREL